MNPKSFSLLKKSIKQAGKIKKSYPKWVCHDCGMKASGGKCFKVSTYHLHKCDVCLKELPVTEPRDYFYPEFKQNYKPQRNGVCECQHGEIWHDSKGCQFNGAIIEAEELCLERCKKFRPKKESEIKMTPPKDSLEKARELIEAWVLGKIPVYEDKIKQIALSTLPQSIKEKEEVREAERAVIEAAKKWNFCYEGNEKPGVYCKEPDCKGDH